MDHQLYLWVVLVNGGDGLGWTEGVRTELSYLVSGLFLLCFISWMRLFLACVLESSARICLAVQRELRTRREESWW